MRTEPDSYLFGGPAGTLTLIGRGEIAALEPATGRSLWRATVDGEIRYWMEEDGVLWTHVSREPTGPDRLVRLDAQSGRRRGQVDLPERGAAGMASVGPDVWVATPGGTIIVVRA